MANEEQKELIELQKELNALMKDYLNSIKESKKTGEESAKGFSNLAEFLRQAEKVADTLSTDIDKVKKSQEAIEEALKSANLLEREQVGLIEKRLIGEKRYIDILQVQTDLGDAQIKQINDYVANLNDQLDKGEIKEEQHAKEIEDLTEMAKQIQEELDKKKLILDTEKTKHNSYLAQREAMTGILGKIGIAASLNETWLGRAKELARSHLSIGQTLSNIGMEMKDVVLGGRLFAAASSMVLEATIATAAAMDSQLASFQKATGAGTQYNDVIDDVRFGSMQAGVGMKESADAVQSLFTNLTSFNRMSQQSQVELARTTAQFDRMGIASQTTAKNLDISTKALGMNIDEAVHAQKEVVATALQLGLSPGMLADQFTASIPQLAQYGKQSVQIFRELATQSKATGIAINDLIGISQQFDTFEGAATAAGKLNAMLGGNLLNSVDLLNASESERIDMLRQSLEISGKNFNEMGKFEQMALANAAGIKDMATAAKLFGTTAEEFEANRQAQEANAISTKTLGEYAANATSAQEKLKLIMEALTGAALPLLNAITFLINGILQVTDIMGGKTALVIIGVTGLLYLLGSGMAAAGATSIVVAGYMAVMNIALGILQVKTALVTAAQWLWNLAITANPIGLIVVGIAALIAGIVLLIKNFDVVTDFIQDAWDSFMSLSDGISNVTGGFADVWDVLLMGVPVVGWAIIAGRKIYENWDSVVGIFQSAVGWVGELWTGITQAFSSIDASIQNTTGGFFDIWDAILMLMGPIGLVIEAGKKLYENWDTVVAGVIGLFENLGKFVNDIFTNILDFIKSPLKVGVSTINSIATTVNKIPGMNIPLFPELADGITNFSGGMALVGENGPELVSLPTGSNVITNENSTMLSNAGKEVETARTEQMIRQEKMMSKMVEKESSTTNNNLIGNTGGQVPVILQIDGREFGRAVINVVDKNIKLNMVGG